MKTPLFNISNWSVVFSFLFLAQVAIAQCPFGNIPYASVAAPTVVGATQVLSTCTYLGEYSHIQGVSSGNVYTFDIDNTTNGFVTVFTESNIPIAWGPAPFAFQASLTGGVKVQWNEMNCATDVVCHTTSITYTSIIPCTNPASGGLTVASVDWACPSGGFDLSLNGSSFGANLTYQWQSSFDGITFNDIVNSNSEILTVSQTTGTHYRCGLICSGGAQVFSTPLYVGMSPLNHCYCASQSSYAGDGIISNVSFLSLQNPSSCTTTGIAGSIQNLYADYTNLNPVPLVIGTSPVITVDVSSCNPLMFGSFTKVFIDWNQNGDLNDAGEEYLLTNPFQFTGAISVPLWATPGNTLMRIINVETNNPASITPCMLYTFGETEDYVVHVVSAQNVSCVTGNVYCDQNLNDTKDAGETGVGLLPVRLEYGNQMQYEQTDLYGNYSFYVGNEVGQNAVVKLDQNWLSQHGVNYGEITDSIVLTSCASNGSVVSNVGVNCLAFTGQVECVYGVVFCDYNGNGIQDSLEVGISNAPIEMTSAGGSTTIIYTDNQGVYSYSGGPQFGTNVIAVIPQWWLNQEGHSILNNSFSVSTDCYNQTPFYIPLTCNPNPCIDLMAGVSHTGQYLQNTAVNIMVVFGNLTSIVQQPFTVVLTVPSGVIINSVSSPFPNVISGNTVTYSIPSNMNYTSTGGVNVSIPAGLPSGTLHTYTISATPAVGVPECDMTNNQDTATRILGASYDPNDKTVNKSIIINPDVQDELRYRIRFQNTGTAPAQDVYIMDTLSANLDWSTLKIETTSHNMQLINQGNGIIKFNFPGIWLPDSTTNQELSNGYLIYTIKEKATNQVNSEIENTAHIFFDWNPAIITNTTLNTNAYLGLEDVAVNEVSVYPNPFADKVTIASAKRMDKLTVLDITGKVIYEEIVHGFNTNVQMDHISQGTYLVRVSAGSETSIVRIVKK